MFILGNENWINVINCGIKIGTSRVVRVYREIFCIFQNENFGWKYAKKVARHIKFCFGG